jgi:hypothetical protein
MVPPAVRRSNLGREAADVCARPAGLTQGRACSARTRSRHTQPRGDSARKLMPIRRCHIRARGRAGWSARSRIEARDPGPDGSPVSLATSVRHIRSPADRTCHGYRIARSSVSSDDVICDSKACYVSTPAHGEAARCKPAIAAARANTARSPMFERMVVENGCNKWDAERGSGGGNRRIARPSSKLQPADRGVGVDLMRRRRHRWPVAIRTPGTRA